MQSADMERDARLEKMADEIKASKKVDATDLFYAAAMAVAEMHGRVKAAEIAYIIADWYGCELELHGDRT